MSSSSIEEILIDDGEKVEKNQVLLKLVDIEFVTQQKMNDEQYYAALSKLERLNFEAKLENPKFSENLKKIRPDLVLLQMDIYQARGEILNEELSSCGEKLTLEQQKKELQTQLKMQKLKKF